MSQRKPFQYVEIDMDYCSRTYGSAPCTAALSAGTPNKCFNTFRTCQDQGNFDRETKTIKLCPPLTGIPVGQLFFPCLLSVSTQTATVNIGGMDEGLSAFGRRAELRAEFGDFPYHDRFFDKYQAERISGAASFTSATYNPAESGTFFARLLRRWPYYANRAVRLVDAYLDGGTITVVKTRNFIIADFEKDRNDRYTLRATDPLELAGNDRAVAPQPVNGVLASDITADATELTLSPTGIGDNSYPASGRATIGNEYVSFTRSGDTVTLTGRGIEGTTAAAHTAGDAFQTSLSAQNMRVDDFVRMLLVDFAGVSSGFIPTATWASEVDRWASGLRITTDIIKPENVGDLIAEVAVLGFAFWWNETDQEIGLKAIRPPDGETVFDLSDDNAIKSITVEDRNDERLTEVYFSHVLRDPTQAADSAKSYLRGVYVIDAVAKSPNAFGDTRIREINCRLLNQGADAQARKAAKRILNRAVVAPKRYVVTLDAKDRAIGLTDVLRVTTRAIQDEAGTPVQTLMQVTGIEEVRPGHEFRAIARAYEFDQRYGRIAPNDVPAYGSATDEQKELYGFISENAAPFFADNTDAYRII